MQPPQRKNKKITAPVTKTVWDYITVFPLVQLAFLLLLFSIYGQILTSFLGKLDEQDIILVNMPFLKNFANLKEAFFRDAFFSAKGGIFYRPLQNVSFMIDAHLSGNDGWGYYLSNILIHGITVSLLCYLLILLGTDRRAAFASSLFFAVSPLFVSAIAWAPSRGDLLTGMFGVLSFIAFIRFIRQKKYWFLVLSAAAFMMAVFSKETALLLPFLFVVYYFFLEKEKKVSLPGLILPAFLVILVGGMYFYLRDRVITTPVPAAVFGITPLIHNLRTLPESVAKFFIPAGLSPLPAYSMTVTLLGIGITAILVFLSIRYRPQAVRWIGFGFLWFVVFTLPGMLYTHPMGTFAYDYLEHRSYLPLIGIACVIFFLLMQVEGRPKTKYAVYFVLLACAVSGTYAHLYSATYTNPVTFYTRAIESNPNSALACYNRGEITVMHDKEYQLGIEDFDQALKIKPDYAKAFVSRGICKEFLGDTVGALKDCEAGEKADPGLAMAHKNIAILKNQTGHKEEALKEWDAVLRLSPGYPDGYNERGIINSQLKHYAAAEKDFNRAIQINNRYSQAYLNRGLLYLMMKDTVKACTDWKASLNLGNMQAKDFLNAYCREN